MGAWKIFVSSSSTDYARSIYGLIAIGYTMVFGINRMVNFAHGDAHGIVLHSGWLPSCSDHLDRIGSSRSPS